MLSVCTEQSFSKGSLSDPVCWGGFARRAEGERASTILLKQSCADVGVLEQSLGCFSASQEPGPAEEQPCQQLNAPGMVPTPHPLTGLPSSAAEVSLWSAQDCKHGCVLHKATPAPSLGPLVICSISSKQMGI